MRRRSVIVDLARPAKPHFVWAKSGWCVVYFCQVFHYTGFFGSKGGSVIGAWAELQGHLKMQRKFERRLVHGRFV